MTRTETIELIAETLRFGASDEELAAYAAQVTARYRQGMPSTESEGAEGRLPRALTGHELALILQSKDDFQAGRTMSLAELERYLDAQADQRLAARSA